MSILVPKMAIFDAFWLPFISYICLKKLWSDQGGGHRPMPPPPPKYASGLTPPFDARLAVPCTHFFIH